MHQRQTPITNLPGFNIIIIIADYYSSLSSFMLPNENVVRLLRFSDSEEACSVPAVHGCLRISKTW